MRTPRCFVILLAAGSGQRFGGVLPKAFVDLDGEPLYLKSYRTILQAKFATHVVVTAPAQLVSQVSQHPVLRQNNDTAIVGGDTRQASVRLALQTLAPLVHDDDIILIHDAARCFASSELFLRSYRAAVQHHAVTAAVTSVDSLKMIDPISNQVLKSLDRSSIVRVQTPQAFQFSLLNRAHEQSIGEFTDDASMVEQFASVFVVEGEETNYKITFATDL